jgi:hypothetical protein
MTAREHDRRAVLGTVAGSDVRFSMYILTLARRSTARPMSYAKSFPSDRLI